MELQEKPSFKQTESLFYDEESRFEINSISNNFKNIQANFGGGNEEISAPFEEEISNINKPV